MIIANNTASALLLVMARYLYYRGDKTKETAFYDAALTSSLAGGTSVHLVAP